MASVIEVMRGLEATSLIHNRKDFERWRKRSKTRRKFLLTAYLIGAIPVFIAGVVLVLAAAFVNRSQLHSVEPILVGFISTIFCSALCGGPFFLIPCWLLLASGLSNYKKTMASLSEQHRVCEVCEAVALFADQDVYPSKHKGHTAADLVPHMNVIEEEGKTSVLCDKCLAEVNAIDSVQ